ncbi:Trans-aconitate 2-methyltransferase [Streptomyces sp. RB5]|uniref:Trans-aconitate 2-methyltransferase n=1 Tax=Streptomyces smaragdinus TaxID=2585196 RepID=A0A7K0CJI3_9ACTN|nr:class I SAM-dependent methyltransferase [Streptomyces smaragdinus]MQY13645.1 Trans-aconitate 2-methyltransferase [Streptomyces smaragdinus]
MGETRTWTRWQESWDRQQEGYLPDREERFRVMLDLVEAVVGPAPRVLDLACGTGSITGRTLARLPSARVTGVDLDPALLTIARGTYEGDERVRFVAADLRDPGWREKLPFAEYDAVLTATALHWLRTEDLAALYGRLAEVVRPGGVFMNADHMPDPATPRLNAAERAYREGRGSEGAQTWAQWWADVAADPVLGEAARERFAIFGDPNDPSGGKDHFSDRFQTAVWHAETLRAVGFAEARQVWASPTDGMVLGLR